MKAPLTGLTSWRINLNKMLEQAIRDRLQKKKNNERPSILCLPKKKNNETLLACGKLKRGYLYKVEAQINSFEFNISASND